MKTRIEKNEEKLDAILTSFKSLEESVDAFEKQLPNLKDVNKYYGSKTWLKDKEDYEKGKIKNVKAGVLSEDMVWNLNERIDEVLEQMKAINEEIKKV